MINETTNLKLLKPDKTEFYNIETQNQNMDKIDGAIKATNDEVGTVKKSVASLETNKANTNHNHDERYYTETEMDGLLGGKSDKGHTHQKSQITDFPTKLPADGGNADTVGGFTVKTNVPADAKFTDTVYSHPSTHPASMITGLPTSLPANGGNADTVDGTHAWQMQTLSNAGTTHGTAHLLTCQYTDAEGMFRLKVPTHQTIVNKADYANSAGNADTVDGYHVDKGVNNTYGLRAIAMGTFDLQAGVTVMSVGDIYIMYE